MKFLKNIFKNKITPVNNIASEFDRLPLDLLSEICRYLNENDICNFDLALDNTPAGKVLTKIENPEPDEYNDRFIQNKYFIQNIITIINNKKPYIKYVFEDSCPYGKFIPINLPALIFTEYNNDLKKYVVYKALTFEKNGKKWTLNAFFAKSKFYPKLSRNAYFQLVQDPKLYGRSCPRYKGIKDGCDLDQFAGDALSQRDIKNIQSECVFFNFVSLKDKLLELLPGKSNDFVFSKFQAVLINTLYNKSVEKCKTRIERNIQCYDFEDLEVRQKYNFNLVS